MAGLFDDLPDDKRRFPVGNVFADLPTVRPQAAPTHSLAAGVLSRVLGLTGDFVEGAARIGEQGGDWLESRAPLAGLTPEQLQQRQLEPLFRAAEWLQRQQQAINYQPSVSWDQVKESPINLPQTGTFVLEQGVTSIPDMAAAVLNLPGYVLSRTNDIAGERATNEGRTDAVTLGDMAKAAPGALVEATLERLATKALPLSTVTGGNAGVRIAKQVGLQAGTEAVEETAAYTGETAGTRAGFQSPEAFDRAMAGALVGGALGGTTQGAGEVYDAAIGSPERQLARAIEQGAQEIADARPDASAIRNLFADLPQARRESAQQNVQNVPSAQRAKTQTPPTQAPAPAAGNAAAPVGVPAEPADPDLEADGMMFDDLVPPEGEAQDRQPVTQPTQPGTTGEWAAASRPAQAAPILQNRNRATPSSIAQMQSIANQPDYGRLGFSRDFANGAPVVAGGQIAPEQMGRADMAVASDGRRIPVQYAVVEVSDVLPSNQADGTPNPDYGNQSVQRIRAIAGNGRIAGLQLAYHKGTAPGYLSELASDPLHGVNPDVIRAMHAPVLVRVMPTDQVTPDIGDVSNTVGNLDLSAVEQASNDAHRVDLGTLSFAEDGSITHEAVRQFVRAMPQAEQGGLIDTNGQPTKQAVDRINAAVFAKAYGNNELIRLFAQAQDPEARNVLSALAQAAPKMARLEGAGALDVRDVVTQAAEIAVNARREGKALSLAAQQIDMAADPDVGVVLDLFARNARTVRPVVEALGRMADMAYTEANKPAEDMFGAVPRASRTDVINQLRPENERTSPQALENPAGGQRVEQVDEGPAPEPARAATPAEDQADRAGQAEGLTSYSQADIEQRLERLEQAQREQERTDRKAEAAERQRQEHRKIEQASRAAADTFKLGQDPLDSLTGQQDIFSVPAQARTERDARRPGLTAARKGAADYNAEAPRRTYTDERQLQLFLDNGPDASQAGSRGEAAQRSAVSAVDDLRSTETLLGLALSRDYAARQRASLVGQQVSSAEDLAVLAQVYRDPRFETFRVVFVNDSGKVVSQVGLTSRLPASAQVIMGNDVEGYLRELSAAARNRGATGFYMLHNHPSGISNPSMADLSLTRKFALIMPSLQFKSHVVIDTNEYSVIDRDGRAETLKKDFGQPAPFLMQEWANVMITGPSDLMSMAKRLQVDDGAVTLIHTDSKNRVKAITTIPASASTMDKQELKKLVVKASLQTQGAQVFAVGRDSQALRRIGSVVVDAIHVEDGSGSVSSLRRTGDIPGGSPFPGARRARVSPDTSPEFAYLRRQSQPAAAQRVAEPVMDQTNPSIVREGGPEYNPRSLQSAAAPWTVPEPGAGDAFIRAIQNNKVDLKRLREAIAKQYGEPAVQDDAYLAEELYHGKVAARVKTLHKDYVEPVLAKIAVAGKNVGLTLDDVNQYLHARHAPERNAAMKAINPDMDNNEALSGMSDAEATKIMADFKASPKSKALEQITQAVDQLLADNRAIMVADGLEDAGVIQAWEAAYRHYVPLQRDVQGTSTPKGMGFSVKGPESKRAVGSNRAVVNILGNIVAQAETTAIRAEKAKVGRALLAMARQYPNPDFWKVDVPPTKPRVNPKTGLVMRNAVDPLYQSADNVVMVKDFGEVHFVVFNPDNERAMMVARSMKNLDFDKMPRWLQIANKGTRFIASLLTARNPEFWVTNLARDIQGALINMDSTEAEGMQAKAIRNMPSAFKGMRSMVRGEGDGEWARYARDMEEAGGTTGYMQSFDDDDARMDDLRKEVDRMQQGKADPRRLGRLTLQFIDDYNNIIENAVRLSVFQAARDAGVSTPKAASIAKNITINFNRKGNATPSINALYMFFNASVQGTARMAQALAKSRRTQVVAGALVGIGFLLDMFNRMAADEDEETGRNQYDLIPEFDKTRNWIIMNPMRPGEYVKIPLPIGFHLFPNVGRLVSDALYRKDPRNASEYGWAMAGMVLNTFSPFGTGPSISQFLLPTLADPLVQVSENKNFMGGQVYKPADRGFGSPDPAPAHTRYFESTPDVWKALSRMLNDLSGGDDVKPGAINVEPDIFRHTFYSLTGGPGRALDRTVDVFQSEARGQETSVNRMPFASRFYGENDDRQRERVFYDERKRVAEAKASFDYYTKEGRRDLAREVAEELGDGDYGAGLRKMREFSSTNTTVRRLNAQIKAEMERQASGEDRAEQLRALRERRTEVMGRAVNEEN